MFVFDDQELFFGQFDKEMLENVLSAMIFFLFIPTPVEEKKMALAWFLLWFLIITVLITLS